MFFMYFYVMLVSMNVSASLSSPTAFSLTLLVCQVVSIIIIFLSFTCTVLLDLFPDCSLFFTPIINDSGLLVFSSRLVLPANKTSLSLSLTLMHSLDLTQSNSNLSFEFFLTSTDTHCVIIVK